MIAPFTATSDAFTLFPPALNHIGGEWSESLAPGETLEILNPRHGRAMSRVTLGGREDVEAAVTAGESAFREWRHWPLRERAQILFRLRESMHRQLTELSWLVSHENGKTFSEAQAEVLKGIECLEFGCSLANGGAGGLLEVSRGVTCETIDVPLGVVAGVAPFNFPLMVPLWMLPQALVAGNAFILKPSERVPLSTQRLAQLALDAGLPKGVLNLVQGGQEVVEALADHPRIKAFGFVGSTRVARSVYARAAASGKRALCLGGAKNHLIVVPDADPELTAENVVASFTGCAGQRCMAASVLLAVGDVQHIIDRIVSRAGAMVLGRDLGPVTSAAARERIVGYIDQAEAQGARVLLDGRGQQGGPGGFWVGPTLLDQVSAEMPAACEEIFGPVLSIIRVPTLERALELENASPYGNAASIYTSQGEVARRVMERVEAGMCGVNVGVPVPREPFGFAGWNDSAFGAGNISGQDGFRFWTRQRKVTTKWAAQTDATWMG